MPNETDKAKEEASQADQKLEDLNEIYADIARDKLLNFSVQIAASAITGLSNRLIDTMTGVGSQLFDTITGIGSKILSAGLQIASTAINALSGELSASIQAAEEAQQVQNQLNAVLQSTGGAAGVSADEVNRYAAQMRDLTGMDDEALVSAQALLLTFTDIKSDVFPEATRTALDMATALNGGLLPSTEQLREQTARLGQVLQDPDAGLGALAKMGVNVDELAKKFTPLMSQEEKQKLILQELATQFGGSAEAAGKTFAGQLAILQAKFGDIQEKIGTALLPVLTDLAMTFSEQLSRPEVQAFIQELAANLANLVEKTAGKLPEMIRTFGNVFGWLMDNKGVILGILGALGTAIAIFAYTALTPLLPFAPAIALIGFALSLLSTAWTENWGGIRDYVTEVFSMIKPYFDQLVQWLQVNIPIAIQALANFWQTVLQPALQAFFEWYLTTVITNLRNLVDWLQVIIPAAISILSGVWTNVLLPAIQAVWTWLSGTLFPFLQMLGNFFGTIFNVVLTAMAGIWQNILLAAQAVWTWLSGMLLPFLQTLANFFGAVFNVALMALAGIWQNVLMPVLQAVWAFLSGTLFPFFQVLANFFGAVFNVVLTAMAGIWQNVLMPVLQAVYNWLSAMLIPVFQVLAAFWQTTLLPILQAIAHWIGDVVVGAFTSLTNTIQRLMGWLNSVANGLNSLRLPDWMTPGSPTPWEIGLWGVNEALQAVSRMSLPGLSASMNMLAAPAVANGNLAWNGGAAVPVQFVYQPFIGVNDEYEAKNKLRSIVSDLNREAEKK